MNEHLFLLSSSPDDDDQSNCYYWHVCLCSNEELCVDSSRTLFPLFSISLLFTPLLQSHMRKQHLQSPTYGFVNLQCRHMTWHNIRELLIGTFENIIIFFCWHGDSLLSSLFRRFIRKSSDNALLSPSIVDFITLQSFFTCPFPFHHLTTHLLPP